jgi:chemotaxis protein CheD
LKIKYGYDGAIAMIHVFDSTIKKPVHILVPGEYHAAKDIILSTIVGSCFVVCLYDAVNKIGGMGHCLLPVLSSIQMKKEDIYTYNINFMEHIIGQMVKLGADRKNFIVKIFGGIGTSYNRQVTTDFIEQFCKQENMNLEAIDIGGNYRRKLYFFCNTGKVHRYLVEANDSVSEFIKMEKEFIDKVLADKVQYGNVILFE